MKSNSILVYKIFFGYFIFSTRIYVCIYFLKIEDKLQKIPEIDFIIFIYVLDFMIFFEYLQPKSEFMEFMEIKKIHEIVFTSTIAGRMDLGIRKLAENPNFFGT